jgi:protein O-mannosyl-transferase
MDMPTGIVHPKPASANATSERCRTAWVCALLALAALAIYAPVYYYDFLNYDDGDYVVENPQVTAGLTRKGLIWAFANLHGEHTYWHPLTWFSHMLDCQLFGLHPGPHHLVNVLFHSANSVLLFLVLKRMTGAFGRSAMVAALFALHPLQVDTVAWVAERKNLLSSLFWLLTMWAYLRYVERSRLKSKVQSLKSQVPRPTSNVQSPKSEARGAKSEVHSPMSNVAEGLATHHASRITHHASLFYLLSLFFFALGLMCKPALVTLPFVLLLLDYWPLRRLQLSTLNPRLFGNPQRVALRRLVLEKVPLLTLAAAVSFITVAAHRGLESLNRLGLPLDWRIANAVVSYVRYLGKAFWPAHLAVLYPHPGAWPEEMVAGSGMVLLALTGLVIWRARVAPYLVTGWLWFLGVLVPMIGIIQAGDQAMADRFAYVPLIGLFIMVAWGAADLARRWAWGAAGLKWASALALGACVLLTSRQLTHWQNGVTLFEHALAVTPDNATAHLVLGAGLHTQGQYERALAEYRAAAALDPSGPKVHYNMGLVLQVQKKWQEAADQYEMEIRRNPDCYYAHFYLAEVLQHLGRTKEAVLHSREALRIDPASVEGLNNLAWVLSSSNDPEIRNGVEAVRLAERACQLTKYQAPILIGTLAAAYAEAGRFKEAIETAQQARALAEAAKQPEVAEKNRQLLELYRSGQPYRQPPPTASGRSGHTEP